MSKGCLKYIDLWWRLGDYFNYITFESYYIFLVRELMFLLNYDTLDD